MECATSFSVTVVRELLELPDELDVPPDSLPHPAAILQRRIRQWARAISLCKIRWLCLFSIFHNTSIYNDVLLYREEMGCVLVRG